MEYVSLKSREENDLVVQLSQEILKNCDVEARRAVDSVKNIPQQIYLPIIENGIIENENGRNIESINSLIRDIDSRYEEEVFLR